MGRVSVFCVDELACPSLGLSVSWISKSPFCLLCTVDQFLPVKCQMTNY